MSWTHTTARAAVAATAASLLLAGCSGAPAPGTEASDDPGPTLSLYTAARTYQDAATTGDWATACAASTARLRGGTLAHCVAAHTLSTPAPGPTAAPDPATLPRYADGSTPRPVATRHRSGPDRADTGAVTASGALPVPASGDHPAGYAVLVTYSVQWPGEAPTITRRALRLVAEGGGWRVDQHEDLQPGDEGRGSPLLAALGGLR